MKIEEISPPVQRKFRLEITESELRALHFAAGKASPAERIARGIYADNVYSQLNEFMASIGLLSRGWFR